jgi:hypothetical protein
MSNEPSARRPRRATAPPAQFVQAGPTTPTTRRPGADPDRTPPSASAAEHAQAVPWFQRGERIALQDVHKLLGMKQLSVYVLRTRQTLMAPGRDGKYDPHELLRWGQQEGYFDLVTGELNERAGMEMEPDDGLAQAA